MPPIIGRSRLRPLRSSPSSRGPRYSRSMGGLAVRSEWPELHLASWQTTCDTLHMWTQIVGKVRLALEPMVNHWWQVPFSVSWRGLTTSLMHADGKGLEMEFDFVDHVLFIRTTLGESRQIVLKPQAVADFYAATLIALREVGVRVSILARPVEVSDAIPFAEDRVHSDYDADAVVRYWPGGSDEGSFYSYAYPEPDGFSRWKVQPAAAFYDSTLREFLLPYTAVRTASNPEAALLSFFQSTYEGAAHLGHWDRTALEVRA